MYLPFLLANSANHQQNTNALHDLPNGKDKKQISSKRMNHSYDEEFVTKLLYLQDIIITSISLLDITPRTVHRILKNMKWINFRQTETCLFSN